MRALDDFHVKVQCAGVRVRADRSITTVGERAALTIAESGDIVFITAKVLLLGGSLVLKLVGWDTSKDFDGGVHLSLKEQNCWLMTCHTISSDAMNKIQQRLVTENVRNRSERLGFPK